jgi:hypothetical protein
MAHDVWAKRDRGVRGPDRHFRLTDAGSSGSHCFTARGETMKAVHLSVVAMIAAASGIGIAIATKNSEALATSILALVAAFLPAVQLALPWFTTAPVQGEMPKFEGIPK